MMLRVLALKNTNTELSLVRKAHAGAVRGKIKELALNSRGFGASRRHAQKEWEKRLSTEHAFTLRKAFYMAVAASFHDQKSPSLLPPIKIFFQWFCPHMKSLKSWFCRPRMLALPTALYLISSCSFLGLNPNVTSQREVSDPPRWGPIPLRYTPDIFHQWQLSHL